MFLFDSRTHPNLPGQPFCLNKFHLHIQYVIMKKKNVLEILGRGDFCSRIMMRLKGRICKNNSFTWEGMSIHKTKYLPTRAQFLRLNFHSTLKKKKKLSDQWTVGSVSRPTFPSFLLYLSISKFAPTNSSNSEQILVISKTYHSRSEKIN